MQSTLHIVLVVDKLSLDLKKSENNALKFKAPKSKQLLWYVNRISFYSTNFNQKLKKLVTNQSVIHIKQSIYNTYY